MGGNHLHLTKLCFELSARFTKSISFLSCIVYLILVTAIDGRLKPEIASCRGVGVKRFCPRSAKAIYLVAVSRTTNLLIERWTLCYWTISANFFVSIALSWLVKMFQTEKPAIDASNNYGCDWYKMKQRVISILFGLTPNVSTTPTHLIWLTSSDKFSPELGQPTCWGSGELSNKSLLPEVLTSFFPQYCPGKYLSLSFWFDCCEWVES